MGNNIINEVDKKTAEVKAKLHSITSPNKSLIILYEYYRFLLALNNTQITEAYIPEFIPSYSDHFKNFDPYCTHPSLTQLIIEQAEHIADFFPDSEIENSLRASSKKLAERLNELRSILKGGASPDALIGRSALTNIQSYMYSLQLMTRLIISLLKFPRTKKNFI